MLCGRWCVMSGQRSWIYLTNRTPSLSEVRESNTNLGKNDFQSEVDDKLDKLPVTLNNGRKMRKEVVYPDNGEMRPVTMDLAINRFEEYLKDKEDMETIMINKKTEEKMYISNNHRFEKSYQKKQIAEFYSVEEMAKREYGKDNLTTVMLTLSASPFTSANNMLPTTDHLDSLMSADNGSWQAVKTAMSRVLSNYESEYVRILEPHTPNSGMYATAGYCHIHVGILVKDVDNTLKPDDFKSVLNAHVNNCETAGRTAHSVDNSISLMRYDADRDGGLGAYLTAYLGEQLDKDPKDCERWFKRYLTTLWMSNRRRVSFSRGAKSWSREHFDEKYGTDEDDNDKSEWEMWGIKTKDNYKDEYEEIQCDNGGSGSYLRTVNFGSGQLDIDVTNSGHISNKLSRD